MFHLRALRRRRSVGNSFRPQCELLEDRLTPGGGQLDPSFGIGGEVVTPPVRVWDHAQSVAIQPDGKIVVVGDSEGFPPAFGIPGSSAWEVVRYNSDGSLDTTF